MKLSRRTFLQGLFAASALPVVPAMPIPAVAAPTSSILAHIDIGKTTISEHLFRHIAPSTSVLQMRAQRQSKKLIYTMQLVKDDKEQYHPQYRLIIS